MIVGICACNQVPHYTRRTHCKRCGTEIAVLLTIEENRERLARGIDLDTWFAAPHVPATRGDCEDRGTSSCPYLRCRNNLGAPGRYGCALEVAEDAGTASEPAYHHTLEHIGKLMNIGKERVRQIEARALLKVKLAKCSA